MNRQLWRQTKAWPSVLRVGACFFCLALPNLSCNRAQSSFLKARPIADNSTPSNSIAVQDVGNGEAKRTIKLYPTSDHQIDPHCDIYRELRLINGYAGPLAILETKAGGNCEILPPPEKLTVNLEVQLLDCGTKYYRSKSHRIDDDPPIDEQTATLNSVPPPRVPLQVEITDNRAYTCESPASFVIRVIQQTPQTGGENGAPAQFETKTFYGLNQQTIK